VLLYDAIIGISSVILIRRELQQVALTEKTQPFASMRRTDLRARLRMAVA
jgi:hypothetical protein